MVVANTPQSHTDLGKKSPTRTWRRQSEDDRIFDWQKVQELRSGKYTLWDHSFELPHKHLETDKTIQDSVSAGKVTHKLKVGGNDKLEIYDFPGEYAQRFDGIDRSGGDAAERTAEDLSGQQADRRNPHAGRGRAQPGDQRRQQLPPTFQRPQVFAGETFQRRRPIRADDVSAHGQHDGRLSLRRRTISSYRNSFTCIPAAVPLPAAAKRPSRSSRARKSPWSSARRARKSSPTSTVA